MKKQKCLTVLIAVILLLVGCQNIQMEDNSIVRLSDGVSESVVTQVQETQEESTQEKFSMTLPDIGTYNGVAVTIINNNVPYFTEEEITTEVFESYSELDELGRCGVAYANICQELMPTEPRGEIGMIKPTGWHTVKYPDLISDNYLYNRCHLIGFQLAGENANEKNLITGTRFLNVEGMLSYENEVADYVKSTGNHVLYRVTPMYNGENPVANGVQMEAYSVEDNGAGVQFCVYCHNVQPGIVIDYRTGESWEEDSKSEAAPETENEESVFYIGNKNNGKLHKSTCQYLPAENNQECFTSLEEARERGYTDYCKVCRPN